MPWISSLRAEITARVYARSDEVIALVIDRLTRNHKSGKHNCKCEYCIQLKEYVSLKMHKNAVMRAYDYRPYDMDMLTPDYVSELTNKIRLLKKEKDKYLKECLTDKSQAWT